MTSARLSFLRCAQGQALSGAKELHWAQAEILRCAQDDIMLDFLLYAGYIMDMKLQEMECAGQVKTSLVELSSFEKFSKRGKIVVSFEKSLIM